MTMAIERRLTFDGAESARVISPVAYNDGAGRGGLCSLRSNLNPSHVPPLHIIEVGVLFVGCVWHRARLSAPTPAARFDGAVPVEEHTEIGPARSEDFVAIRSLCDGFLDWCRVRYGENAWIVDDYYTPDRWAALLDSLPTVHAPPAGEILVARLDGTVVGCVMMQRIDERACEMKRLFVSSEGKGRGLGRRLAEGILHTAAERGYTTMRLDTGRNHDEALRLYHSLGFKEITPYYEPPPAISNHLIFMQAPLTAEQS